MIDLIIVLVFGFVLGSYLYAGWTILSQVWWAIPSFWKRMSIIVGWPIWYLLSSKKRK